MPGIERRVPVVPHVETVVVDFARTGSAAASSEQVFHGGWGTVGVPGCLHGYLDAHERRGRLPLPGSWHRRSRWPAAGVQLSAGQRMFMHLVSDLLNLTEDSRSSSTRPCAPGRYANPAYADLLEEIGDGTDPRPGRPRAR